MPRKTKRIAGIQDQGQDESHAIVVHVPATKKAVRAGQWDFDNQSGRASPAAPNASEVGHSLIESHYGRASPLASTIAEIRAWHRDRVFAMETRKRADLALGAFLRRGLGWSRMLPKGESDRIKKGAQNLIALGEKVFAGKETGIGNSEWAKFGPIVLAAIQSRAPFDAVEKNATKEMECLGASLPVWAAFCEQIKGFGPRSLAVILAETGDLSNYANPSKVWKRMGLAVMNGVRQGGLRKTATAEDWIAHGYSAKRRSYMFVIGDVLIKNQNPYRALYLERKQCERNKAEANGLIVAPAAKIPAKRKNEFMSDGHIHRRAQRYMEKRLLRDLWKAWRRAKPLVQTNDQLPVALNSGGHPSCETQPRNASKRRTNKTVNSSPEVFAATSSAQADPQAIHRAETIVILPAEPSSACAGAAGHCQIANQSSVASRAYLEVKC